MFIFYGGSLLTANSIIINLMLNTGVPKHWSGRINVKKLKELRSMSNDTIIKSQATKAILLLKFGKYVVYIGLFIFIMSMVLNIK